MSFFPQSQFQPQFQPQAQPQSQFESVFSNAFVGSIGPNGFIGGQSPRPSDSDPLGVITWYLENRSTDRNCCIRTPSVVFELQQFDFIPFTAAKEQPVRTKISLVSLCIIHCMQRSRQPTLDEYQRRQLLEADCELRLLILRHVLKEMIRLKRWDALTVARLNEELSPHMDPIYNDFITQEINKLQPHIRPTIVDHKLKSLQIIIQKS